MKVKAKKQAAQRAVVYGAPGTGKSTLAAHSGCVVVDLDDGLGQLECPVLDTDLSTLVQDLAALASDDDCKGVAIDTADALERLIWQDICRTERVKGIELAHGGYGKGYVFAAERLSHVLSSLSLVAAAGKPVLVLAHAVNRTVHDPLLPEHDRAEPRLHKHAVARLLDWADVVGYATLETSVDHDGRARGTGKRVLRVQPHPAALVKTRYGTSDMLPLSWDALVEHCSGPATTAPSIWQKCHDAIDNLVGGERKKLAIAKLAQCKDEQDEAKAQLLLAWIDSKKESQ